MLLINPFSSINGTDSDGFVQLFDKLAWPFKKVSIIRKIIDILQAVPPHIAGLLGQNLVVTLIGACDAILYRTVLRAVLPTAAQVLGHRANNRSIGF